MNADVYRQPQPKSEPRTLGSVTIAAIRQVGRGYVVQFTGKDGAALSVHAEVGRELAETLRLGMRVRLVVEDDLL